MDYLTQLKQLFKNIVLNATGIERDFYTLLQDGDVEKAIGLMSNNDDDVDAAIKEYDVHTHAVMSRPNKYRKRDEPYITEKLPRNRQQYINEVEVFFLLGNPVIWEKDDGDDDIFELFTDFIRDQRYDAKMRACKRIAGAETESAKLYRVYQENGKFNVDTIVLGRSKGFKLRALIDQYNHMKAFAYGYTTKESDGKVIEHWDVQTKDMLFFCTQATVGWEVNQYSNPLGKIGVLYYNQQKAWYGAEARIAREEMLDSKVADTNNYFADPIAKASADVIESLCDPDKPGKLIQMLGSNSTFEYVSPPQSSELRASEQDKLEKSILFDSFTPDLSFEALRGFGSVSGVAIRNAMTIGYIKRNKNIEIYGEMLSREVKIIKECLKLLYPDKSAKIDELDINYRFAEPFAEDERDKMMAIASLLQSGACSTTEAVYQLGLCEHPDEEIRRIKEEQKEKMGIENKATAGNKEN